jgi:hypothetical protein
MESMGIENTLYTFPALLIKDDLIFLRPWLSWYYLLGIIIIIILFLDVIILSSNELEFCIVLEKLPSYYGHYLMTDAGKTI